MAAGRSCLGQYDDGDAAGAGSTSDGDDDAAPGGAGAWVGGAGWC